MPVSMTAGGQVYYLHYDQVGSLKVVTDAAGTVTKRVDYDSFGNILSDSNPAFTVPFGFAGGLHDRRTGLVRFGARDYDPATGKWTAKDPIDFAGGDLNLMSYVGQDPVNWVDPEGLFADVIADVGFIAWDIYDLFTDPCNFDDNLKALGLDIAGAVIPFATGLGKGYKAGKKARSIWTNSKTLSPAENALQHWNRHGDQFPELRNAKEYVEATDDFLNNPASDVLRKTRSSNGDVLLYNPGTNTFGVRTFDGTPRTMFKPDDGIDYWHKQ
jgi:RHS repeat-associated protein